MAESEETEGWDGVAGWGEELSVRAFFHPNLSEIQREVCDFGAKTRKNRQVKLKVRTRKRNVMRRKKGGRIGVR